MACVYCIDFETIQMIQSLTNWLCVSGEIEEVFYQLAYTLVARKFGRERYPWQSNRLLDDEVEGSIASSKGGCC